MNIFYAKEFQKQYSGTWTSVQLYTGERLPAVIHGVHLVDEHDGISTVKLELFRNKNELEDILSMGHGENVELGLNDFHVLPPPNNQVFDAGGISHVYKRSPNRQWARGVCRNNATFTNPYSDLYDYVDRNKVMWSKGFGLSADNNIRNLLIPNVAGSLHKAIEQIELHKLISRCINDKYFVGLIPNKDDAYMLYRMQIPIATYTPKNSLFVIENEIYRQELEDFCKRNHLYVDIRNK